MTDLSLRMTNMTTDPRPGTKIRRGWKPLARFLFIYAFIPYLSIVVIVTVFQRRLMYQPSVADDLSVTKIKLAPEVASDVQIRTPDGRQLKGWLIYASRKVHPQQAPPLVIYFPGNAGNRHERLSDLREIGSTGFDVLIFDYRGYGDSTGNPSESALTADAQLIWQFGCKELKYPPDRIVLFGESLGGAVTLSLWSASPDQRPHPAAVILNSTFASMPGVVAWHYPLFPFQFLLFDRWRSIDRITHVPSPVVIFHGTADDIVPLSQGRLLASRSNRSQLIEVAGGTHNSIPMASLMTQLKAIRDRISDPTEEEPDQP